MKLGAQTFQSGGSIDRSEAAIDRSEVAIDRSEVAIDRSEVAIDRSEIAIDRSEVAIDRSEVAIDQSDGLIISAEIIDLHKSKGVDHAERNERDAFGGAGQQAAAANRRGERRDRALHLVVERGNEDEPEVEARVPDHQRAMREPRQSAQARNPGGLDR